MGLNKVFESILSKSYIKELPTFLLPSMLYLVIKACLYSKDLFVEALMTFSGWPIINVRSNFGIFLPFMPG